MFKPGVVSPGAVVFSCGPLSVLADYSGNAPNAVEQGGLHLRYSGSSMASPVVAGIGALYFEKCPGASWSDFKRDLNETATEDAITGTTPNFSWGNGRANAFRTLIGAKMEHTFTEDTVICTNPIALSIPEADSVLWMNTSTDNPLAASSADSYSANYYINGCVGKTDTIDITVGSIASAPVISINNLILTSTSGPNYQWYLDGNMIDGATSSTHIAEENGDYTCVVSNASGCNEESNMINVNTIGINENQLEQIDIFPNPTNNNITITSQTEYHTLEIIDLEGRLIRKLALKNKKENIFNLHYLKSGVYTLKLVGNENISTRKLIKNN
mgnify:CR=1 FL=1